MKTASHNGQRCYFDEEHHKYFVGDVELTSVTNWIGSFFSEFDSEYQADKYAKKHHLKVEDVLADWEAKAKAGEQLGNTVHGYAESIAIKEPFSIYHDLSEKEHGYMTSVEMAFKQLRKKYKIVRAEMIVFSVKLGLAGQIDLLVRDLLNGDYVIFDWKSNKTLDKENYWQSGIGPIEHLMDCNFNHYQLQLSTYQTILEEEEYFVESDPRYTETDYRRGIIHLRDRDLDWHKVEDWRDDVRAMLNWV